VLFVDPGLGGDHVGQNRPIPQDGRRGLVARGLDSQDQHQDFPSNKAFRLFSYGARATPASVMMAVTRRAGVTSNAEWRAGTSSGAMRVVPACFTSSGSRSSMGISFPEASDRSIVDSGAAT